MGSTRSRAGNRQNRRDARRKNKNSDALLNIVKEEASQKIIKATRTFLKSLNEKQALYEKSIQSNTITFGTGAAGTGKTHYAVTMAAQELRDGNINRLVITRPAVEAGENLGFLPGDEDEKFEPYLRPVRDALEQCLGSGHLEYLLRNKSIEARPLAYLRGASFKDCWIILDEAQNTTPAQMQMFLTRIGTNCKAIVNGDMRQKDINGSSGLADAVRRFGKKRDFGHVNFEIADIVRSGICKVIVRSYMDEEDETSEELGSMEGLKRVLCIS